MTLSQQHRRSRRSKVRGLSLLEVMVAVAILGLGLTAILSAQAGAFSAATHARSLSLATGLARCKMMEVEEKLKREGFQETDENDSGPCCDDDDNATMRCTWRIEKPELPEPQLGSLDLDTDLSLDTPSGGALGGSGSAGISGLMGLAGNASSSVPASGANLSDVASGLTSSIAESGGVDGIAAMAMSFVYPDLKRFFEAGTRRVTVTVHWADGSTDRTLEIVQWFTLPAAAPPAAAMGTGTTTSPGQSPPFGGGR